MGSPTLLKFDVLDQPIPMRELNPFWEVHPPHLDGYFQSKKGQFKLIELDNGTVKVEGTTWYHIHIHPVPYWDFWSKFILHEIHFRVLKHIKKESEKKSPSMIGSMRSLRKVERASDLLNLKDLLNSENLANLR